MDIMYAVPSDPTILKVIVTADSVTKNAAPIVLREGETEETNS